MMSRGKKGLAVVLIAVLLMSLAPAALGEGFSYEPAKARIPFAAEGTFTLTEGDFRQEEDGTYSFVENPEAEPITKSIPKDAVVDENGSVFLELEYTEPGFYTYRISSDDVLNDTEYMIVISVENGEDEENPAQLKVTTAIWRLDTKDKVDDIRNYFGSLRIVKSLDAVEISEPATFVFQVEATKPDADGQPQIVYSNVAAITLDGSVSGEALLHNIPAGATVEVKEVYSGSHYALSSSESQTATIVADVEGKDTTVTVNFANHYEPTDRSGHGVENSFSYDEDRGWLWRDPATGNLQPAQSQHDS